jgi:hypothetical protein
MHYIGRSSIRIELIAPVQCPPHSNMFYTISTTKREAHQNQI